MCGLEILEYDGGTFFRLFTVTTQPIALNILKTKKQRTFFRSTIFQRDLRPIVFAEFVNHFGISKLK